MHLAIPQYRSVSALRGPCYMYRAAQLLKTSSMPRKWCWDASAVLDLCPQSSYHSDFEDGYDFTCIGVTKCGFRCHRSRGKDFRHKAAGLLLLLGRVDPRSEEAEDLLLNIAIEMLCYQHDNQAEHMQRDWMDVLDDLNTEACQVRSEKRSRPANMHTRAPAYTLPEDALWDPFLTIKLNPDGPAQCIGFAPSMHRKCHNPVAYGTFTSAIATLEALGQLPPDSSKVKRQLPIIAKQLLCLRKHQAQHVEIVEKWGRLITAVPCAVSVKVRTRVLPSEAKRGKPKRAQVTVTECTDATPRRRAPLTTKTTPISNSALPRTPTPVKPTSRFGLLTPPASQEQVPQKLSEEPLGALDGIDEPPAPPSSLPKVKAPTSKPCNPLTSPSIFSLPTPPSTDPKTVQPKKLEEPISSSVPDTSSSPNMVRAISKTSKPPTGDFTFSLSTPPPSDPKAPVSNALGKKVPLSCPIDPSPPSLSPTSAPTPASPTVSALVSTSKTEARKVFKQPTPSASDFSLRSAPLPPPESLESLDIPKAEPPSSRPASRSETLTSTICDPDPFTTHSDTLTAPEHLITSCLSARTPVLVGCDVRKEEGDPLETPYTPTRPSLRKHSPATREGVAEPIQGEAQVLLDVEELHGHATVFPTSNYIRPASLRRPLAAEVERSLDLPVRPEAAHTVVVRKPLPSQEVFSLSVSSMSKSCSSPEATATSQVRSSVPVAQFEGVEDRWKGTRARARRRGWRWLRSLLCIPSAEENMKDRDDSKCSG